MNITIYTKSNCPNCTAAKQLLQSKGLNYFEINCDNPYEFDGLRERHPEAKQLPQIIINNQRVGGLAGLRVALNQMELL